MELFNRLPFKYNISFYNFPQLKTFPYFWLKLFGNRDMDKYKEVVETLIRFRDERDWAQFHDSKNLALALLLEASELNELFLWKKND